MGINTWHHNRLSSQQGAAIQLDFQTQEVDNNSNKPTVTTETKDLWANVRRADLGPGNRVVVSVRNEDDFVGNSNSGYFRNHQENVQTYSMAYAENGRFTVNLRDMPLGSHGYGGDSFTHQLVEVTIDGEKQTDPLQSGASAFNVSMAKAPAED